MLPPSMGGKIWWERERNVFLVPSEIGRELKPSQMMGESHHLGSVLFTVCEILYCMAKLIIDLNPNSREEESDSMPQTFGMGIARTG
jgi:hypothetical protein